MKVIWNNLEMIFQKLSRNVRDKILASLARKEKKVAKLFREEYHVPISVIEQRD